MASYAVELRRAGSAGIRRHVEQALAHRVAAPFSSPAQLLLERLPTGISALDAQVAGLPRGSLTEICGPASSGRTTVLVAALAAATQRGEACCLIDATDAFDPRSAAAAGVELPRLLWVRCGGSEDRKIARSEDRKIEQLGYRAIELLPKRSALQINSPTTQPLNSSNPLGRRHSFKLLEKALKVADLVLQGGGFGLVAIDLADVPNQAARRVPLTSWFRFRRAVEKTPTVLLAIEQEPNAKTCASLVLRLAGSGSHQSAVRNEVASSRLPVSSLEDGGAHAECRTPPTQLAVTDAYAALLLRPATGNRQLATAVPAHSRLLRGLDISVEVLRTPERKQPSSVRAQFATRRIG